MKFINLIFFIITIFSNSFCGIISNKQKPKKSHVSKIINFAFALNTDQRKKLLREKIEEIIKTKTDINSNHKMTALDRKKYDFPLLAFAVDFLDLESVKLLLENGANPNIE